MSADSDRGTDLEARHTARHDALLDAALGLLAARQGRMLTIEEWASLARAVTGCILAIAPDPHNDR